MEMFKSLGMSKKQFYQMNTLFLFAHVAFFFWYYFDKMPILFYYNLFSICVFSVGYIILRRYGSILMSVINFAEIFIFMVLNVLLLGWDYGFQFFCIGFAVSGMLVDFILNHRRKVSLLAKVGLFFLTIAYIFLYFWCQTHEPLYDHGSSLVQDILFLSNALLTIALILGLLWESMNLVYDLEDELENAATHDVLTGLHNRRYMTGHLNEWKQAGNTEGWIAILDLDHFKNINDSYGHDAGDLILQTLGMRLRELETENPNFLAARWGGEEFSLFYRIQGEKGEFIRILDDFREDFGRVKHLCGGKEISCTVTIGAAEIVDADVDKAQQKADDRLYIGKESGRNRMIYQE